MKATTRFFNGTNAERLALLETANQNVTTPYAPKIFFETDTGFIYINIDGTGWVQLGGSGGGGSALLVREEDNVPSDAAVATIRVPNGTLTINASGDVSLGYEIAGAVATHVAAVDPHTQYATVTDLALHAHTGGADGAVVDHASLTDVTADQHHNHATAGADGEHSFLNQVISGVDASTTQKGHAKFDSTNPTTQAFGDAPTPGVSGVMADRAHKHGMPASPTNALLDGVAHTDTTAGTVARGDVITGQGASAKWVRLAKAADRKVLTWDGTDAVQEYKITRDVYANRPAAAAAQVDRLFLATDRDNTMYRDFDGTTWEIVNPRRIKLVWYIDGRQNFNTTTRIGAILRMPSDLGTFKPIRGTINLVTAATEGASNSGTATSGSASTLADTAKNWTAGQWRGALCTISAGTNAGKVGRVKSNTGGAGTSILTFEDAFSSNIDATSVYSLQSGVRVQIVYGTSSTPATNLFSQPASDATAENRLVLAPTVIEATSSTFLTASIAADTRFALLVVGIGALSGSEGTDLSVTLDLEQTDG